MNKQLRDEWLADLRSGKFKQGSGRLQRGNTFCCLGVLCMTAKRVGIAEPSCSTVFSKDGRDELQGFLLGAQPAAIREQIKDPIADVVSQMNDGNVAFKTPHDFSAIASWIELNVPVEE